MPSDLKEFMLAEYQHIATAHFETGKQVSTYFNYYLLILAAPVVIATLIQNKNLSNIIYATKGDDLVLHWIVIIILLLISIVGWLICWIVIEIHHDSILYARTVNGIRKYFYDGAGLTSPNISGIQVLPTEINKPDFFSYGHLFIFVIAFALLNSSFLCGALYLWDKGTSTGTVIIPIFYFLSHILVHYFLSDKRTKKVAFTNSLSQVNVVAP